MWMYSMKYYDTHISSTILNGEKLKAFSLRIRTRQGCSVSSLCFKIVLEVLTRATGQEKGMKKDINWKGGNKIINVCRWHDSVKDKTKGSHKRTIGAQIWFGKVARYKVNTQKSIAFVHTNNAMAKNNKHLYKDILFTIATKF